jgi:predicted SnoaL-like aldol condensation-catalyzing enzyme
VPEAFDTLFNRRDGAAAERFWSKHIQHSAHIPPGRDGLFRPIKSLPEDSSYELGLIMADDDMVMLHGRFTGSHRPVAWIGVDTPYAWKTAAH